MEHFLQPVTVMYCGSSISKKLTVVVVLPALGLRGIIGVLSSRTVTETLPLFIQELRMHMLLFSAASQKNVV